MIIEIYTILFATAIIATASTVYAGVRGGIGGVDMSARAGMVFSAACLALWALLGINAFEITVHSGGEAFTQSYPQLAWVAVAGVAIALLSLLQASIQEFNQTGGL